MSDLDVDTVPCNHTTTSCECRQNADVCIFTLRIELRHSFTRYYIDPQNEQQVIAARVYYFGDDGELYGHSGHAHPFCSNATEDDVSECTPAFTFDASTFRPFIGVNGQVPGPNLIVSENQTVVVNVSNELQMQTVSIHWHGMYQYNTYFMDGVQHITQCAIDPHTSFRYIFKASPSGTHWYHSHTGVQRSDGLFGALIVRESKESGIREALWDYQHLQDYQDLPRVLQDYQDLPAEHTIIIADWFREDAVTAYSLLETNSWFYEHTGSNPPGPDDEPEEFTIGPDGKEAGNYPFWSALINGKGKHPDKTYPYLKSRLAVFSVDPDKVYRFRLIGSINNYAFRFSIDEHELLVVGTDGHWVEPVPVDYIALQSGERYDFLLLTKCENELSKNNYWMRAEALEIDQKDGVHPNGPPPYRLMLDRAAESILHYNMPRSSPPTSRDYMSIKENSIPVNRTCNGNCRMMNCPWRIHPSYNIECKYVDSLRLLLPSNESILPMAIPDEEIFFQFGTEGVGALSSVNGRRSRFPSVPPKLTNDKEFQEIYDAEYCKNLDDPDLCYNVRLSTSNPDCWCVHMRNLTYQKSYRFVFTVAGPHGAFSHPVHMHGHSFFVVKIGLPPMDNSTGYVNCFSDDIDCTRYPLEPYGKCGYVTNPQNMSADYTCPATEWATGKQYTYPPSDTTASGKIDPRTPRKDTVLVPVGGYAIIDIVTDNPGVWFMHCHVENHAVEGMGVVLNEAQPNQNPSPQAMRQCGNFGPTLEEFYNWLEFNQNTTDTPNPPTTAAPQPTTAAPQPTTAAPQPTTTAPQPTTATPTPTTCESTKVCHEDMSHS